MLPVMGAHSTMGWAIPTASFPWGKNPFLWRWGFREGSLEEGTSELRVEGVELTREGNGGGTFPAEKK